MGGSRSLTEEEKQQQRMAELARRQAAEKQAAGLSSDLRAVYGLFGLTGAAATTKPAQIRYKEPVTPPARPPRT